MLQRRQVILEHDQTNELLSLARYRGTSVSSLIRKYVGEGLKNDGLTKMGGISPRERILKSVEKIRRLKLSKAPADLSVNLDHYLYGAPKK